MSVMIETEYKQIPLDKIIPSPSQPRANFNREELEGLANSIKEHGVLSPILVRPLENGNYEIIAGERRWRACTLAKLDEIPAIVKNIGESQQRIQALIENVQRTDLEMHEKGKGFMEILKTYGITSSPEKILPKFGSMRSRINSGQKIRNDKDIETQNTLLEICKQIGSPPRTIMVWLQTLTVNETILDQEINKSSDEKISGATLARLSTIEDPELQKSTYHKINEYKDDFGHNRASKFISAIKQAPEEEREIFLEPGVKIDLRENGNITPIFSEDSSIKSIAKWEELEESRESLVLDHDEEEEVEENIDYKFMEQTQKIEKHVDKISKSQLESERTNWNLERFSNQADFFTMGSDGKNLNNFISNIQKINSSLEDKQSILIDVRYSPFSMYKPDFNKQSISDELRKIGVEYKHYKDLGVSKELRNKLFSGEISEEDLWVQYEKNILTIELKSNIRDLMVSHKLIFLCTESSPIRCHRHVIAKWLENEFKLKGWDV